MKKRNSFLEWIYKHNILANFIIGILLFLVTTFTFIVFKPLYSTLRNGVVAQSLCALLALIVIIVGIIFLSKKKLTYQRVINIIILLSFIVRLCYMLTTPYTSRQHDVFGNGDAHEDYAIRIFLTGLLPETNDYQFYHPPLNASIQALFMNIMKPFLRCYNSIVKEQVYDVSSPNVLFSTCQILSVMYMTITTMFSAKIVNRLKLSNVAKLAGISFICLFPQFINLCAQLNNDALCIMFSFIAIYLSLVWMEKKDWLSICLAGLFIGLAMNSKISGATICLSIAIIFVWEFVKAILSKDKKVITNIILQFIVFIVICAPIGLWFPIYAKKRFNQDLGFVFGNLNSALYTGDHSFFERFVNIFDFKDMSKSLYCSPFENYNLFGYLVKCSLFGEFSYWQGEGFAFAAVVFNYLFVLMFIVITVIYFVKSKSNNLLVKIFAASLLVLQSLCMLYFNIKMPYGCTMDFRYIVPILIGFGMLLALFVDEFKENKVMKMVLEILVFIGFAMLLSSNIFYLVCI